VERFGTSSFTFDIKDTASLYNIYVVFRHTDAYNFNNLWLNVTAIAPMDTAITQHLNLKLADNNNGWLGSGMDDIFEHRIKITRAPQGLKRVSIRLPYSTLCGNEPLQHVMNVGIRVQKARNSEGNNSTCWQ
jgi:gliding motility-associated lipoprotein GldH